MHFFSFVFIFVSSVLLWFWVFLYYLHIDIWNTYQSVCIMCQYGKNVHKNVVNAARSKITYSKVILEINLY